MKADRHILSPMFDDGSGCHYFVDEPMVLKSGAMIVPLRWILVDGVVHAEAVLVTLDILVCSVNTWQVIYIDKSLRVLRLLTWSQMRHYTVPLTSPRTT